MNTQIPTYIIAVSGLNAIDSPGPGIPVIRALRESSRFNVRIVGLCYENLEPGIYLHDLVDKSYHVPYPSVGRAALLERLQYIHSQEHFQVLIPNFDAELYSYICLQPLLKQQLGVDMLLPSKAQFEARHKVNLSEYGANNNIKVPEAQLANSEKEALAICENMEYPLVVKGKFYDAKIAYSRDQVSQAFNKISMEWGGPVLIQEYLRGTELNVCGIGDGTGQLIGAVPMKKLYITDKGKAWAGVTISDEELLRIAEQLVSATKWKGPFELEFIKTDEDEYYLIEINPRFPAWCYLPVGAGQNQVEVLVLMALGELVAPMREYQVGKMFVRYSYDLLVDIEQFRTIAIDGEL